MSKSGVHEPSWAERSGWTLGWELKRWAKCLLAGLPGRIGSGLRCRLYGFGSCGHDVFIAENFWAEYPKQLHIGEHTGVNRGLFVNAGGGVTIDSWVLIGPSVTIYSQNHDLESDPGIPFARRGDVRAPVHIGRGAWLAANVTVLPGVTIGEGAVVAAGAVVTHDVLPHSVVAGVPARQLRLLSTPESRISSAP